MDNDDITKPNPQFKDRLFKAIFKNKRYLLMLYNALNETNYTKPDDIEMTTLKGVIYINMKNDVSFIIDSQMNLYEQQSTYNPNMPLRGLMYFAQLYQVYVSKLHKDIYSSSLIKIPAPNFIVIYNGKDDKEDKLELCLSDAFIGAKENKCDWVATMININKGHNAELLSKCYPLQHYAFFVDRIRDNRRKGLSNKGAVEEALNYCIKQNMLDGFFRENKMEVLNMSLMEFNQEEYDRNRREEGREAGLKEGLKEGFLNGLLNTAKNMLDKNLGENIIAECTGLSLDQIHALQS